jgi:tetratricopeptide (TPR) repeat protein
MSKQSTLFFSFFIAVQSFAQNLKQDFARLIAEKDTSAQLKFLQSWQKQHPEDAELFVAYFNYYFINSQQEIVHFGNDAPTTHTLEVKDSVGDQTLGYLSASLDYNRRLLKKSFQYIDAGIHKYPTRLDMRFGKIYALLRMEDYEAGTSEIISAIEAAGRLHDRWTWTDHRIVDDPKKFFLKAIQDYVLQLYNAGDAQLIRMRKIAQAVLRYYPDHVESMSNLAITYGLQGHFDRAIATLLKAEKIAPADIVVLSNIATMYERKGDKQNADKYYERVRKCGKDHKRAAAKKDVELCHTDTAIKVR